MVDARSPCHKKSGCKIAEFDQMSASSMDSEAEARSRVESAAVSGVCVCACPCYGCTKSQKKKLANTEIPLHNNNYRETIIIIIYGR